MAVPTTEWAVKPDEVRVICDSCGKPAELIEARSIAREYPSMHGLPGQYVGTALEDVHVTVECCGVRQKMSLRYGEIIELTIGTF